MSSAIIFSMYDDFHIPEHVYVTIVPNLPLDDACFSICRHDSFGHDMRLAILERFSGNFFTGFYQGNIVVKESRDLNQAAEPSIEKKREV